MNIGTYRIPKFLWIIPIVLVLFFGAVFMFNTFNTIQKTSVTKETRLSAEYLNNQNELSSYIVTIKEKLQIADRKTDKLDQVLSDAVRGRYDGHTSAQPGQGQLFSAITEAYPEIDLTTYDKVSDAISAGREAFKNKQSQLLDLLREYDRWRQSGLVNSQFIKWAGVPSNKLVARVGDTQFRGEQALEQMYKLVLAEEATDSFKTGTLTTVDLNPTTTAAK